MALSRVIFQYNGRTGYPVCLTLRESEPYPNKFAALPPGYIPIQCPHMPFYLFNTPGK